MKQEFCCEELEVLVEDPECYVKYIPYQREYVFYIPQYYITDGRLHMYFPISYCSWCGMQLPKNLSSEWYALVKEKFGLTDFAEIEVMKLLPEEFRTNQWWKKRKL
jgi:hypothetical protein